MGLSLWGFVVLMFPVELVKIQSIGVPIPVTKIPLLRSQLRPEWTNVASVVRLSNSFVSFMWQRETRGASIKNWLQKSQSRFLSLHPQHLLIQQSRSRVLVAIVPSRRVLVGPFTCIRVKRVPSRHLAKRQPLPSKNFVPPMGFWLRNQRFFNAKLSIGSCWESSESWKEVFERSTITGATKVATTWSWKAVCGKQHPVSYLV